jgi:S-DNA-T family DNA segregation ATPase FtsK/SpoIIIE
MLWGVCGGLAPAVRADLVRLWGVDLKRGVELMMGRALFSAVAITPSDAIATLCRLLEVVEERGRSMAGVSVCTCRGRVTLCTSSSSTSSRP